LLVCIQVSFSISFLILQTCLLSLLEVVFRAAGRRKYKDTTPPSRPLPGFFIFPITLLVVLWFAATPRGSCATSPARANVTSNPDIPMTHQALKQSGQTRLVVEVRSESSPFTVEFYWVQGSGFRCMAYQDQAGKWYEAFCNWALPGPIRVLE
jgi:hypothetical protein